jgi:iron complex outermembrane receptor protein
MVPEKKLILKSKRAILFLIALFTIHTLEAQVKITGYIGDSLSHAALPMASVTLEPGGHAALTDSTGSFAFSHLKAGAYLISVSYLGYQSYTDSVRADADRALSIYLNAKSVDHEAVLIDAIRAGKNDGFTHDEISRSALNQANTGRDLPYLIDLTPSLVTTSDAGGGVGYMGVRIRGSDASRINVTINGVPLNDAESQNVYFVDLPDLASSVEDIQVQRGVGTSTNGAGAFGGSINIMTNKLSPAPYASSSNAFGSFNTIKNNLSLGTGLIKGHWGFEGRLSRIKSDGYIDRASSDLKSYYASGGYFGKKSIVRFTILSGAEITYQAWNGVPEYLLETNRTYNAFTYENQVDNYKQNHYQLLLGYDFLPGLQLQVTLHDTKGKGYYEEYKEAGDPYGGGLYSSYGLPDVITGGDTIASTDLVRRKWLDNNFYGATFALVYEPLTKLKATLGGAWNQYDGDHFDEIIWARHAGDIPPNYRYEDDNAFKTDFNVYVKCYYEVFPKLSVTGDLQLRQVVYHFTGIDPAVGSVPQVSNMIFFNPKLGISWMISQRLNWYASISKGSKEPSRDDFTESPSGLQPSAETMADIETGFRFNSGKISATINYFQMIYKNQLVLTGKVNDVGNYTRVNVPDSYRKGLEAELKYSPFKFADIGGNITLSENKIKSFDEYIDNYDDGSQLLIEHEKTHLAFSPSILCMGIITIKPVKSLSLDFITRHVGLQYLDNTSGSGRKINDYTVSDIQINYSLYFKTLKELAFSLTANNIFSKRYVSNGYTFSYIYGGVFTTENYYFPQALSNLMAQVTLKF